ncbi:arylamine N-acetyltransferase 2-like [Gastrophryne carolinensis]
MDLKAYFQRIGLPELSRDTFTPSLQALRELHRQHVLSIPFECLSTHIGEKIHLDIPWIFQKIVVRRRGGFCYEQNGLFWWALQELGFQTKILSARVKNVFTGVYGPPLDHMMQAVKLEGRQWLCDVAYGADLIPLLPLEEGATEKHLYGEYRLCTEGEEWCLYKRKDDLWRDMHKFTLEERKYEDFREMCVYHQTSPRSLLVQKSLCLQQFPRNKLVYIGFKLISMEFLEDGGIVKTSRDLTEDEIPDLLRDTFGFVLDGKLIPKDDVDPEHPYVEDLENL